MIEKNIYLIGFMGAGKSSVSQELARISGWREVDMDAEIVRREGRTIPDIFARDGEAYFRKIETELLEELAEDKGILVSCGGGVILSEVNRDIMKKSGEVIFLSASPETILSRVKQDENRPLLKGKKTVKDIQELLSQRIPYYEKALTRCVTTDGKNPTEIAKEIFTSV